MLNHEDIDFTPCENRKNLLAFSAGVDSTALFFLLLDAQIAFDIAIVNYNTRPNSKKELAYAQQLAQQHDKKIHFLETTLEPSKMEQQARHIRYDFFESLIKKYKYETLITAHQLNDQVEWFLMQFTKGAGTLELLGMQKISDYNHYQRLKPLLDITKETLQAYLDAKYITYFIDESNQDEAFKRNYFRHNFSDKLLKEYHEGVQRSLAFLQKDQELLLQNTHSLQIQKLTIIKAEAVRTRLYHIDKDLKKRGYLLSGSQRQEIESHHSVVISDRFVIEQKGNLAFIAPYTQITMHKAFKETCRSRSIPNKIRPYLFSAQIDLKDLQQQISLF